MPVIRSDDFTEPPFPPVADEPSPPRSAFQIRSILGALSPPLAAADGNKLWDLASAWCSLRVCESIDLGEHGTVDFASAHSLPSPNVPFHCSKKRRISREINLFTNSQASQTPPIIRSARSTRRGFAAKRGTWRPARPPGSCPVDRRPQRWRSDPPRSAKTPARCDPRIHSVPT